MFKCGSNACDCLPNLISPFSPVVEDGILTYYYWKRSVKGNTPAAGGTPNIFAARHRLENRTLSYRRSRRRIRCTSVPPVWVTSLNIMGAAVSTRAVRGRCVLPLSLYVYGRYVNCKFLAFGLGMQQKHNSVNSGLDVECN